MDDVIKALKGVSGAFREIRDSLHEIAAEIKERPVEVMTLAKLRAMEDLPGGDYCGEPYIVAGRTYPPRSGPPGPT